MSLITRLLDKSPHYMWQWIPAKRHMQDLMASMDMAKFEALKAHKNNTKHPHYKKYFNMDYWLRKNMQRVLFLGLHRGQARLRVLDLGAGFGYFPAAAAFFGHEVVGIDLPGDQLFDEACKFLEVDCRHHTIEKHKNLPEDLGGVFDLITAFQVCFNDHYEAQPWGADEWKYFIEHVFEAHLKPGGRIYLEMNYHDKLGAWLPEDVQRLFEDQYGARFIGSSRVIIEKPVANDDRQDLPQRAAAA